MATLITPLLTLQSAQAATGSDLSITKTVAIAKTGTIIDESQFIPQIAAMSGDGEATFTDNGLYVRTKSSTDKSAQYWQATGDLPTSASMAWTQSEGNAKPGLQIVFDIDGTWGNGNDWNVLVGEPTAYGDNWWLTDHSSDAAKNAAPQPPDRTGTGGSAWFGTLPQWKASLPATARVWAVGFSLGSGAGDINSGTLASMTYGAQRYDFGSFGSLAHAQPGDTVEYKLVISNGATATASVDNSLVEDTLPSDVTPLPDTLIDNGNGCSFTGQKLTCTVPTLPAGFSTTIKFKATVSGDLSTAGMQPTPGHWVDVQKQETFLEIPVSDHSATGTATCPAGYVPTDGGLLVDSVDQDGFYSDIVVDSSKPTAGNDGWTVSVRNLGDARATGKVKVTCLKNELGSSNGHAHTLQVDSPAEATITSGSTKTVTCPSGDLPFAPRFEATGGIAVVRSSYATGSSWTWVIDREAGASVTVGVNCLAPQSTEVNGHTAPLDLSHATSTTTVGAEQRSDTVVLCPEVDGKRGNGIVGGYQSGSADLLSLGAESRGNNYMFRFWNDDYDTAQQSQLSLACIGVRTADEQPYVLVRNTATVTDADHHTFSSSADLQVSGDAVTPTSGMTVIKAVLLTRAVNVRLESPTGGAVSVKVLKGSSIAAKGSGTLPADTATTIRAKLNSFGAHHLSVGDSVKIKVTIGGHTTTLGPVTLQ